QQPIVFISYCSKFHNFVFISYCFEFHHLYSLPTSSFLLIQILIVLSSFSYCFKYYLSSFPTASNTTCLHFPTYSTKKHLSLLSYCFNYYLSSFPFFFKKKMVFISY
ncbi:MAG: hypothetical protein ACKPKO_47715, partial [Candidatus Fonsibacter sp.]